MAVSIIRRTLALIPVLFVISVITFLLMHSVPGSPFATEDKPLPPQIKANLEAFYGLDQPLVTQYLNYMGNALQGDLGPSYLQRNRTVNDIIRQQLPPSATLGLLALGVALLLGVPIGILSAVRQNTWLDYVGMFVAVAGVSVPAMTLGPLLIWGVALELDLLPVARWGTWQQAILPSLTLGLGSAAILARLTRASMLQVIHQDYIRTARSKGLGERTVINKHALRNALIPVVTVLGPLFAALVTGSMVVEQIFAIPGLGRYFVDSVAARDYPVIMGTTLLYAVVLVISNLLVDISYTLIDPRIRLEDAA
ncbi:MAG TPA: ABC transporter permease [Trueperaceae bacterium]|nr:ABC transporter permease [Trueperaceae bacterium]